MIVIWNSIIIFFVYYFVKGIVNKILSNGINETVFSLIHNTELDPYKTEHFLVYNLIYTHGANIFACVVSLIVYNLMNNALCITILLAIFSLMQIVSSIFMNSSDTLSKNKQ